MKQGINSLDIKQRNRGLVLRRIITGENASRISVAREIGLTKMTVSNIVTELIEMGYLEERHPIAEGNVGRNPVLLEPAAHAPLLAGIYLSRDSLSGVLTDLRLNIICREEAVLMGETAETLQEKLFTLTDRLLAAADRRILGIGVSAIGLLDTKRGVLLNPRNFFGIENFPIVRILAEKYGFPVFLHNDMKASALAETMFGGQKGLRNFVYLGITNGIGSGIVVDGRLFGGDSDASGEIGHLSLDVAGPLCSCGRRGCLETYASMPVILERLKETCGRTELCPDQLEELADDWRAAAVLEEIMEKVASALTDLVNLLDIEAIIVGHEGVYLPGRYYALLEDEINLHMLASGYRKITVLPSAFGTMAPLLGSACCVLQALFAGTVI